MIDIRGTSASDWRYVSEGGATIVFAYIGASNPDLTGMVLRLRKAPNVELPSTIDTTLSDEDKEFAAECDDATIAFQTRVTSQLVPLENLPKMITCRVSAELLVALSSTSLSIRPKERTEKDSIDTCKRRAVLATDLVGSSSATRSLAVEIKPKWAFLPNPTYLSPETLEVKTTYSRFVMHSYYRSITGSGEMNEPDALSKYDPLDLFSGNEGRVTNAVECLWDAWISSAGSANNLKVFVGGKTMSPANEESTAKALAELISPIVDSSSTSTPSLSSLKEPFVSKLTVLLTSSTILTRLATLQRTLDSRDIEGLQALWAAHHAADEAIPALGAHEPEPSLEEWEEFVKVYLSRNGRPEEDEGVDVPTITAMRYHILAYLMSATFKDCSIILRFPASSPGVVEGKEPQGSITAIDLDPKSVKRLEKWAKLDTDIASAYSKHLLDLV